MTVGDGHQTGTSRSVSAAAGQAPMESRESGISKMLNFQSTSKVKEGTLTLKGTYREWNHDTDQTQIEIVGLSIDR